MFGSHWKKNIEDLDLTFQNRRNHPFLFVKININILRVNIRIQDIKHIIVTRLSLISKPSFGVANWLK